MFIFSLGTVRVMLLFGLTATFLPRKFIPVTMKARMDLSIFHSVVTFIRAVTLALPPGGGCCAIR
jgi:hypothetical protein